jgi:tetraacyldisaccharide 4'-kinase
MVGDSPPFWWHAPGWQSFLLSPVSALYGRLAARRLRGAPRIPVGVPVLCVGNFTVGGSGKTPVTAALARAATAAGLRPGILSRGHGGSVSGPHLVDPHHDLAKHVGDEPLLLARHAPVAVSRDRAAAAKRLIEAGCDFLVMDDGFQSARIAIDYALLVVGAGQGIGNGRVIPGGPLRAPVTDQLPFADALLKLGDGTAADDLVRKAARAGKAVYEAHVRPLDPERFAGRRFLAFAGIGHPARFFDTVAACGGAVAATRAFADHHVYAADELRDLVAAAAKDGLDLVTTEKDAARLAHGAASDDFLASLEVLAIEAEFDLPHAPRAILDQTISTWKRKSGL